ncbi:hypothetical protein PR048_019216 [Dryococelus australis]|uniref:Uncharacterized protein n=1 Tax=Dryococelus australis TaxID=614101 RepID=A0ABQ9H349_9NEOP|nr:hypothetical protein PR048_019216 [Dryococelus australis]
MDLIRQLDALEKAGRKCTTAGLQTDEEAQRRHRQCLLTELSGISANVSVRGRGQGNSVQYTLRAFLVDSLVCGLSYTTLTWMISELALRHNSPHQASSHDGLVFSQPDESRKLLVEDRQPGEKMDHHRAATGRGSVAARGLAFHQGKADSIPGGVASGFSHAGIVSDNAAGRQVSPTTSCFPRPCSPTLLHFHLVSPSSALKIPLFKSRPKKRGSYTGDTNAQGEQCFRPNALLADYDFGAYCGDMVVIVVLIAVLVVIMVLITVLILIVLLMVVQIVNAVLIAMCLELQQAPTMLCHWSMRNMDFVLNNTAPRQATTMLANCS